MKKIYIILSIIICLIVLTIVSPEVISIISENPNTSEGWKDKAFRLYDSGKYEESVEAYNQALKIDPKDGRAWMEKGWALYGADRYTEAIETFDQSLKFISPSTQDYPSTVVYAKSGREAALSKLNK